MRNIVIKNIKTNHTIMHYDIHILLAKTIFFIIYSNFIFFNNELLFFLPKLFRSAHKIKIYYSLKTNSNISTFNFLNFDKQLIFILNAIMKLSD